MIIVLVNSRVILSIRDADKRIFGAVEIVEPNASHIEFHEIHDRAVPQPDVDLQHGSLDDSMQVTFEMQQIETKSDV